MAEAEFSPGVKTARGGETAVRGIAFPNQVRYGRHPRYHRPEPRSDDEYFTKAGASLFRLSVAALDLPADAD